MLSDATLNDLNNALAVLVLLGMVWFLVWAMLDERKSKKIKHEYFLHNEEEDWG